MSTFRKDGYCIIRSGFVQEIRSESPDYPYGTGTPNPACGEGVWLPPAIKNLRLLSLRAKRMSRA
jgi:hypothetical protein